MAAPSEDVGTKPANAGAVTIVYGSVATFGKSGSRVLTQEDLGGDSEKNDRFGMAVAIGDVDANGCKDLDDRRTPARTSLRVGSRSPSALPHGPMSGKQMRSDRRTPREFLASRDARRRVRGSAGRAGRSGARASSVGRRPSKNIGKAKGAGTLIRFRRGWTAPRLPAAKRRPRNAQGSGANPRQGRGKATGSERRCPGPPTRWWLGYPARTSGAPRTPVRCTSSRGGWTLVPQNNTRSR